jgi:hypothetical protein
MAGRSFARLGWALYRERMTDRDPARRRWLALIAVRLAGALAATLGVVLIGRAEDWGPRVLGVAIVIAAIAMSASVTGHLARRWRSTGE